MPTKVGNTSVYSCSHTDKPCLHGFCHSFAKTTEICQYP